MPVRILHFADAHIDCVSGGKRDPATGFSYRTLDFLKAFDTIVDTAIDENVDLVLFAKRLRSQSKRSRKLNTNQNKLL